MYLRCDCRTAYWRKQRNHQGGKQHRASFCLLTMSLTADKIFKSSDRSRRQQIKRQGNYRWCLYLTPGDFVYVACLYALSSERRCLVVSIPASYLVYGRVKISVWKLTFLTEIFRDVPQFLQVNYTKSGHDFLSGSPPPQLIIFCKWLSVFCDVASYSLVEIGLRLKGNFCLCHRPDDGSSEITTWRLQKREQNVWFDKDSIHWHKIFVHYATAEVRPLVT